MKLFTAAELKVVLLAVGVAAAAAILITVIIGIARRPTVSRITEEPYLERSAPDITEIIIPEEFTLTGGERWYFFREPISKWNQEQVDQFWIDPSEIGVNLLERESNKKIEDFIQSLP